MRAITELAIWQQLIILIPMGVVLLCAAYTDWRQRKVFNKLTYPAILIGLVCHTIAMGWAGLIDGFLAAILTFVIGLAIIFTGWIKGGDIKLLMAVGAFVGLRGLFDVFFYATIAGFVQGVIMSIMKGYLRTLLTRIWHLIKGYMLMLIYRTKNFAPTLEEDERSKIPFAIAIFFGAILATTEYTTGYPGLLRWYLAQIGLH